MDIKAIADAAEGQAKVVVDNTFATPFGQRPLELGADIVVHSATKLIGGHSDLLLGMTVTKDEELANALRDARTRNGATPGALEAYLALRGLRTMPVRLAEESRTAEMLAERLGTHPKVTRVRYPGFGMMVAFELDNAETADAVCAGFRLIRAATSLGGVESWSSGGRGWRARTRPTRPGPVLRGPRRSRRPLARPSRTSSIVASQIWLMSRGQNLTFTASNRAPLIAPVRRRGPRAN